MIICKNIKFFENYACHLNKSLIWRRWSLFHKTMYYRQPIEEVGYKWFDLHNKLFENKYKQCIVLNVLVKYVVNQTKRLTADNSSI